MNSGFKTQCVPDYRLLTESQVREIHRASLEILETVGVQVSHEGAIQLLKDAGCRIKGNNVVQIPNWLVEECIRSVPSRITMYNRKGKEAMRLEGRNIYFGLGTDLISTVDLETGETRPSCLQDVANAATVADYCAEVDFVASFALPGDVPVNTMYIECARAMMENSVKPIFFTAAGQEDLAIIIEMAAVVAGGEDTLREKPFLIHYSEPTAPLTHSRGAVRKLFLCAEKGIPICYTPGDMLGATTPVTLAGGVAQANAEALSGIVLHQLKGKGAPIISGFGLVPMDMRTGIFSYGAPDFRLTNSAFADIYHYYGIPMWSTVGSDAHSLDAQAAMEHAFGTLMAALDGANLIHDIGYLGQGLLGNPAAIVMCDEIIGYVKRIMRGFDIGREKMGVEVIREVGPAGNFLTQKHTATHFRQELWQPRFLNRDTPKTWMKKGSQSYEEIVTQKAIEILEMHQAQPLPENVRQEINEIARKAEMMLADTQFVA
ncbi:MAG: trimethylamine methyltransferase family protein [Chloroflexota bacterium]|nr:trimethylamine methyltransferase family protein [Chloroflexota bacterium]